MGVSSWDGVCPTSVLSGVGDRLSVNGSCRNVGRSGMFSDFTFPKAVNSFTLLLFTRNDRPFLSRSNVPLGKVFMTRYGPSHLSSSFSLVSRKIRRSRKTNWPGERLFSTIFSSCRSLYFCEFRRAFLVATCLFKNKCRKSPSIGA